MLLLKPAERVLPKGVAGRVVSRLIRSESPRRRWLARASGRLTLGNGCVVKAGFRKFGGWVWGGSVS